MTKRSSFFHVVSFLVWSIVIAGGFQFVLPVAGGKDPAGPTEAALTGLQVAEGIIALAHGVSTNHIDPPTRQQMLLGALKGLFEAAHVRQPLGLSLLLSELTPGKLDDALRTRLTEMKPEPDWAKVDTAMRHGLLSTVPGAPRTIPAAELKVSQQLAGNRYVGIGVVVTMSDSENLPQINETFPGGSGREAGLKGGDYILAINAVDTTGKTLGQVISQLRGDEGTTVELEVKQPKEKSRLLKIVRRVVPIATLRGFHQLEDETWSYRLNEDPSRAIGYVRFTQIGASTVHELRLAAEEMERQGMRGLVIDLRGQGGNTTDIHHTVLLADALLEAGPIGRVRTLQSVLEYQATRDALFADWPLIVLVDENTSGEGEFLAAAWQDNKRARVVGFSTRGYNFLSTPVLLPGEKGAVLLANSALERASDLASAPPTPSLAGRWKIKPDVALDPRKPRPLANPTFNQPTFVLKEIKESADHPQIPDYPKPSATEKVPDDVPKAPALDPWTTAAVRLLEETLAANAPPKN